MNIDIVIIAVIVGYLAGGRLRNLETLPIKGLAFIIALGAFAFLTWMIRSSGHQILITIFIMGQYLALLVILIANRRLPGLWLIVGGLLLNFLVMALNQGRMPVSRWAAVVSGQGAHLDELIAGTARHILMGPRTILAFLGDFVPIPPPYPLPRVLSPGDLLAMAGLIWLTATTMKGPGARRGPERAESPE